jgi:hypothetical protein
MSIAAKLKKLVEREVKGIVKGKLNEHSEKEDLENCSDAELIKHAEQLGLEDSIVRDGEGGLANRDEIIQAINNVDASADDLEEEVDELEEAGRKLSPYDAKEFLKSIDALGKDFFQLRSETTSKIVDYAKKIGYRKSPSAPGSTGRMFFYYLTRLADKASQGEGKDVENESVEDENMDTLIPESNDFGDYDKEFYVYDFGGDGDRYTIVWEGDLDNVGRNGAIPALASGVDPRGISGHIEVDHHGFLDSLDDPESEGLGKRIKFSELPKPVQKFVENEYAERMQEQESNPTNESVQLRSRLKEAAPEEDFEEMDLPKDEDDTPLDLDADKEGDLSQDETEEEPEKITVVVVSPDLKKDESEDEDELDSSYNLPDTKERKLINTKEHMDALHEGEELSEEFKEKAKVIFESALREQSEVTRKRFIKEFNLRKVRMQKDFDKKLKNIKEELIKEQAALVDGYLSEAVDTWIAENEVTLESNVRTELTEEFIDGLKHLFSEHYIEVPTEKFDLVKAQEDKIKQLEESVEAYKQSSLKNLKEAKKLHCESVINKATSNMTELDKVKFIKLVESVEFDSIKQFESKVKTLKESYMTNNSSTKKHIQEKRTKKITTEARVEGSNVVSISDAVSEVLDKI